MSNRMPLREAFFYEVANSWIYRLMDYYIFPEWCLDYVVERAKKKHARYLKLAKELEDRENRKLITGK